MLSSDKQKTFRLANTPVGSGQIPTPLSMLPEADRERIIKGKISELNSEMLAEIDALEKKLEAAEKFIEDLQDTLKDMERRLSNRDMTTAYFYNILRAVLPRYHTSSSDSAEHVDLVKRAKAYIFPKSSKTKPKKEKSK